MNSITITQPDDFHVHFRDEALLKRTVGDTSATFARALVMPNLSPPVLDLDMAQAYQQRILAHSHNAEFTPLMTLYLTETMSAATLKKAAHSDCVVAAKYYPKGATTGSDGGVRSLKNIVHLLDVMQEFDLVLCLHGEDISDNVDVFDREKIFIESEMNWLVQHYPQLKIVFEHISTKAAADFVLQAPNNVAATITPQHLLCNRNDMLKNGIKPDLYCKPILKCREDQFALQSAALSGNKKFFLGTDSAPHSIKHKYTECGCAGCYSAFHAIELYAEFFHQHQALDKLEAFSSHFGADFYSLKRNTKTITLEQSPWNIPDTLDFADENVTPFLAGHTLQWRRK